MKYFILTIFLFSASIAYAQNPDLIITISGDSIKCKLVRVEDAEVQFRINNGPVIHMDKRGVASFQYNYATAAPATSNNRRETRENYADPIDDAPAHVPPKVTEQRPAPLTSAMLVAHKREVLQNGARLHKTAVQELMANTDAIHSYNTALSKNRKGTTWLFVGAGIAFAGGIASLAMAEESNDFAAPVIIGLLGGGGAMITGLSLKQSSKRYIRQSVNRYNIRQGFTGTELKFGITGNGVALVLNF